MIEKDAHSSKRGVKEWHKWTERRDNDKRREDKGKAR